MKTTCLARLSLLLIACYVPFSQTVAQTPDSVVITGRIRHLSARLYRQSSTVLVSRNNILSASRELVRPAPLNADGTFRVSLPLIYPQEELYFNYGRISTAFLAAPGTVSVELDADSLFTVAVPFTFGGVNAQVNNQFARYKAFEAALPNKPDLKKVSQQASEQGMREAYGTLLTAYQTPINQFARREQPFPLVARWITSANRYNVAAFLYDKAAYEQTRLPVSLDDSLRSPGDILLTAARAQAMNRFAGYVIGRAQAAAVGRSNGLSVRTLATLLERYGKNLTADERTRLNDYALTNSARQGDLRFFDGIIRRSPDTLQQLVAYETLLQRTRQQFDSSAVNYVAAYRLAQSLPGLTLDFAKLLYSYARPQVRNPQLAQSLDELYRLEVKDSVRVRAAVQTLRRAGSRMSALDISSGVFVTRDRAVGGLTLLDQVLEANRGRIIYVLLTNPENEAGRQAAQDAQRLRSLYSARDVALVYVPLPGNDANLWPQLATRYNLVGDHLLLSDDQLGDVAQRLRSDNEISATLIGRTGKIIRRNAPLPAALDEIRQLIDKNR